MQHSNLVTYTPPQELMEPEVLCACHSPIDIALDLEEACRVAARISPEHAECYLQLARLCQTFAKDFLACCQVPRDAELLLSMKNANNTFGRALKYNEKEFLTQPWIQVVCEKQWLGELDGRRNTFSYMIAMLQVLLAPLLVPTMLVYGLILGNVQTMNKFVQLVGSPCLCFFAFVSSNVLFFILLMLIGTDDTQKDSTVLENLAWVWLLGKLLSDLHKYYKVVRLTSFKVSVLRVAFDCVYMTFFGALFVVRVYTSTKALPSQINMLVFVADVMYGFGTILHILQLVYSLQVTKFFGQIFVSVRFLFWELLRFLAVLLLVNLTFSIALTNIFSAYNIYEKTETGAARKMTNFTHFTTISTTLFWASFCLVDLNDFREYKTHIIAELLIACYVIVSSGLLLMLLFAMINYQYSKAKKRFDTEWKFLSVKLAHEFSLLHPSLIPFNLVSLPISIIAQALVRMFGNTSNLTLLGGKHQVRWVHVTYSQFWFISLYLIHFFKN